MNCQICNEPIKDYKGLWCHTTQRPPDVEDHLAKPADMAPIVSQATMRYWMTAAIERDLHLSPPQAEEGRAALTQCLEMAESCTRLTADRHALAEALQAIIDLEETATSRWLTEDTTVLRKAVEIAKVALKGGGDERS